MTPTKGNPVFLLIIAAAVGILYLFSGEDNSMGSPKTLSNPKKKARGSRKAKTASRKARKKLARVYRNLNTGTLSAQFKQPNGSWKVGDHPHRICLKNVSFKVNEAGRNRVHKEKTKNVHAVIEGEVVDKKSVQGKLITYDPNKQDQFETKSGKEVFEADEVCVESSGRITAKGAK